MQLQSRHLSTMKTFCLLAFAGYTAATPTVSRGITAAMLEDSSARCAPFLAKFQVVQRSSLQCTSHPAGGLIVLTAVDLRYSRTILVGRLFGRCLADAGALTRPIDARRSPHAATMAPTTPVSAASSTSGASQSC